MKRKHSVCFFALLLTLFVGLNCTVLFNPSKVSINPASYNFGEVAITTSSSPETFVIKNTTLNPITITRIEITGQNFDNFNADKNGFGNWTVQADGGTIEVSVSFNPDVEGVYFATLEAEFQGGLLESKLTGEGVVAPTFDITPTAHAFGDVVVSFSETQTFTVTNDGTSELVLDSISITDDADNSFSLTSANSTTVNPGGGTDQITVQFSPTSVGDKSANLRIEYNLDSSPAEIPMTGKGLDSTFVLIPNVQTYDFGTQYLKKETIKNFTILNIGDVDFIVNSVVTATGTHFKINGGLNNFTMKPHSSQNFAVEFSPNAEGALNDSLTINHTAKGSPTVISLAGFGKADFLPLENFEGSSMPAGWTKSTVSDWEWGRKRGTIGPTRAHSGNKCMGTKLNNYYSWSQDSKLYSPVINLTNAVNPTLSFYSWIKSAYGIYLLIFDSRDGGWLEIQTSPNGTGSWSTWQVLNNLQPGYNITNFDQKGHGAYGGTPGSSSWEKIIADLSQYKGLYVKLCWCFSSDIFIQEAGWYIDNVQVVEADKPAIPSNPLPFDNDVSYPTTSNSVTLQWDGSSNSVFDVLFDTVNPPVNKVASKITSDSFTVNTTTGTKYYWQVLAETNNIVVEGPIWHFEALDRIPKILINEIETGQPDYIELFNADDKPVNIDRWILSPIDGSSQEPDFVFSQGTILAPKEVIIVWDAQQTGSHKFKGAFDGWWNGQGQIEVILRYSQLYGYKGVDYFALNYSGSGSNKPSDLSWAGNLNGSTGNDNIFRNSSIDTDSAADWSLRPVSGDSGSKNPNQ